MTMTPAQAAYEAAGLGNWHGRPDVHAYWQRIADAAVPPGWKLVPVQVTQAMLAAVDDQHEDKYVARGRAICAWVAMLAAAPDPLAPAIVEQPTAADEGDA